MNFLAKAVATSNIYYVQMYNEAGALYEKCDAWEKAASVYVKSKNWLVQFL